MCDSSTTTEKIRVDVPTGGCSKYKWVNVAMEKAGASSHEDKKAGTTRAPLRCCEATAASIPPSTDEETCRALPSSLRALKWLFDHNWKSAACLHRGVEIALFNGASFQTVIEEAPPLDSIKGYLRSGTDIARGANSTTVRVPALACAINRLGVGASLSPNLERRVHLSGAHAEGGRQLQVALLASLRCRQIVADDVALEESVVNAMLTRCMPSVVELRNCKNPIVLLQAMRMRPTTRAQEAASLHHLAISMPSSFSSFLRNKLRSPKQAGILHTLAEHLRPVVSFSISGVELDTEETGGIEQFTHCSVLNIAHARLTLNASDTLHARLTELWLDTAHVSEPVFKVLGELLNGSSVRVLSLSSCPTVAGAFSESWRKNESLETLHLHNCNMTSKTLDDLCQFVQGHNKIRQVGLAGNNIKQKVAKRCKMSEAFGKCATLTHLLLGGVVDGAVVGNPLGEYAAHMLTRRLVCISVSACAVAPNFGTALSKFQGHHSAALRELYCDKNTITAELADALRHHTLSVLTLDDCLMADNVAALLLPHVARIEKVSFTGSTFTGASRGGYAWAAFLDSMKAEHRPSPTLKWLSLEGANMFAKDMIVGLQCVAHIGTLETLLLSRSVGGGLVRFQTATTRSAVPDAIASCLAASHSLTQLRLDELHLRDADMKLILSTLATETKEIRWLTFENNQAAEESKNALVEARFKKLEYLSLRANHCHDVHYVDCSFMGTLTVDKVDKVQRTLADALKMDKGAIHVANFDNRRSFSFRIRVSAADKSGPLIELLKGFIHSALKQVIGFETLQMTPPTRVTESPVLDIARAYPSLLLLDARGNQMDHIRPYVSDSVLV